MAKNEFITPVFILAGNYEQALYFARQNGYTPKDIIYVSEPSQLYGAHNQDLLCYGTWYERTDAEEIRAIAKHSGFNIHEV